jgi:isopenicillin N synthase-like dioxygenase
VPYHVSAGRAHERLDPSTHGQGDLKESFYIKRFKGKQPQQQLPNALQQHKEELADFFESCRQCSLRVLEGFAMALELPKEYFAQHHDAEHDRLRLIHYPPAPVEEHGQESGQIRAGSHSDYGSCTLLFQKDVGGLQVEDSDQKLWIDVPPVKGCLVCNVGDAMEFWTSGGFKSTYHRVAMPRDKTQAESRFSMAYFCQPSEECRLVPLKQGTNPSEVAEILRRKGIPDPGKPLTGGEHLRARLAATY